MVNGWGFWSFNTRGTRRRARAFVFMCEIVVLFVVCVMKLILVNFLCVIR